MEIITFNNKYYDLWDDFVEKHSLSTIYHTSLWLNLLHDTFGYAQKGFILLNGDTIVGGLTLFEVKGFSAKRLVSSPFRDRGGLLMAHGVDSHPLLNAAVDLCRKGAYDLLVIKEDKALDTSIMEGYGFMESTFWVTTTVDLLQGSGDIWRNLKNNAQGPVRQAEREGIRACFATKAEEMELFVDMFTSSRKRLGIPTFPKSFFINMWYGLCLKGKAHLLLAYTGAEPIAGIVLLIHRDTVIDGYAASINEYRKVRPNDLLIWRALEWAAENGYSFFDFGADSPRQKNLLAFKKKWAGVHRPMLHYIYPHKAGNSEMRDSSDSRYAIARSMIARLPLPLFRFVSKLVVSRLG